MRKKIINSPEAAIPVGPYSHAVRVGELLFLSGQIAIDKNGTLHMKDLEEEFNFVIKNIRHILATAGIGVENIVKASIFLKNMGDFAAVNEFYARVFSDIPPPARECVEVSRLPKDVNIEMSIIAHF